MAQSQQAALEKDEQDEFGLDMFRRPLLHFNITRYRLHSRYPVQNGGVGLKVKATLVGNIGVGIKANVSYCRIVSDEKPCFNQLFFNTANALWPPACFD